MPANVRPSAVLAALTIAGCSAETNENFAATSSNVVGGAPSTGDPAVVALILRRVQCEQPTSFLACSGILVAPRVVLTAAHCLSQFAGPAAIEVAFGGSAYGSATRYVVASAGRRHAKYNRETRAYDAALLRLAEPAPVEPFAWKNEIFATPTIGMRLRAVGFGITAPRLEPDGLKRTGTMVVLDTTAIGFRATPDPALTCSGDSGGPVFTTVEGVERLIGLSVNGDTDCAQYAGHTRTDILTDFIDTFVKDTESAAVGPSRTGAALDTLCTATCRKDADCPSLLPCVSDGMIGHCQLTEPAAKYGEVCTSDRQCGSEKCGRLWPNGPDACRCAISCGNEPTPIGPTVGARVRAGGGGCTTSGEVNLTPSILLLLLGAVGWSLRSHRQRSTRAGDQ